MQKRKQIKRKPFLTIYRKKDQAYSTAPTNYMAHANSQNGKQMTTGLQRLE